MLTHFYLVFQVEILGNAFLANLGPLIFKNFPREHAPGPPRHKSLAMALQIVSKAFQTSRKQMKTLLLWNVFQGRGAGSPPSEVGLNPWEHFFALFVNF